MEVRSLGSWSRSARLTRCLTVVQCVVLVDGEVEVGSFGRFLGYFLRRETGKVKCSQLGHHPRSDCGWGFEAEFDRRMKRRRKTVGQNQTWADALDWDSKGEVSEN